MSKYLFKINYQVLDTHIIYKPTTLRKNLVNKSSTAVKNKIKVSLKTEDSFKNNVSEISCVIIDKIEQKKISIITKKCF